MATIAGQFQRGAIAHLGFWRGGTVLDIIAEFSEPRGMTYPGGKNGAGVYQTIINLMPPHEIYIEPFLGGGAIMRLKRPASLNLGFDLVESVVSTMKACTAGRSDARSFEFEQRDGLEVLERYPFSGNELVYCDPPYLMSTRKGRRIYEYEMSTVDHRRLLRCCRALKCMVMISGYWSEMYAKSLHGWNSIHFQAMTRGGNTATEWVWFNFPVPVALHDYGFLGANFRERERIKRKKQRWTLRLQAMPILERRALLSAIASIPGFDDSGSPIATTDEAGSHAK